MLVYSPVNVLVRSCSNVRARSFLFDRACSFSSVRLRVHCEGKSMSSMVKGESLKGRVVKALLEGVVKRFKSSMDSLYRDFAARLRWFECLISSEKHR